MGRILVIGNGFDLAHGLPTRYIDFLYFASLFSQGRQSYNNKVWGFELAKVRQLPDPSQMDTPTPLISHIDRCRKTKTKRMKNFKQKFKLNPLIHCFLSSVDAGHKWVDFEGLLQLFIAEILNYMNDDTQADVPPCMSILFPEIIGIDMTLEVMGYVLSTLKAYLDECIDCIDFYFNEVVYKTGILVYPKELYQFNFDYLLSFNYSDTYNRVCKKLGKTEISDENIHFIHGKTGSSSHKNNMVLGISDYEPDNLNIVYFKKYFQRIQKHTGITYTRWLMESNEVYFVGHSMDITDGDIIKKLITETGVSFIFYYSQKDYEQKVINLIKIFGPNEFEQLLYCGKLHFLKLKPSVDL